MKEKEFLQFTDQPRATQPNTESDDKAGGAGIVEGETRDEPMNNDKQSDEDSGCGSGLDDDSMDEEKGEEEDMSEEVELKLFADQHEDALRKAPERLRQPVPDATYQGSTSALSLLGSDSSFRVWAVLPGAEYSIEQLTNHAWVCSETNRTGVMCHVAGRRLRVPTAPHIHDPDPAQDDVAECYGAALCRTCMAPMRAGEPSRETATS